MKVAMLVFLLSLCNFSLCVATDLSQREAAERLMTETRIDKISEAFNKETQEKFKQQLMKMVTNDADRQTAERFFNNINVIVNKELGWQNIKDDVVTIYAGIYTKDELTEMAKFFSSPAGQSFITKAPELNEKLITLLKTKLQDCLPELKKLAADMEKEMANKKIR